MPTTSSITTKYTLWPFDGEFVWYYADIRIYLALTKSRFGRNHSTINCSRSRYIPCAPVVARSPCRYMEWNIEIIIVRWAQLYRKTTSHVLVEALLARISGKLKNVTRYIPEELWRYNGHWYDDISVVEMLRGLDTSSTATVVIFR